jgi:hypothetical protein
MLTAHTFLDFSLYHANAIKEQRTSFKIVAYGALNFFKISICMILLWKMLREHSALTETEPRMVSRENLGTVHCY